MRIRERFNPRAPCGARRQQQPLAYTQTQISTHAPLAGRDSDTGREGIMEEKISTHAPLAGRDPARYLTTRREVDFNPRAPCGARRGFQRAWS